MDGDILKVKLKDHKPITVISRKSDDEVHVIMDLSEIDEIGDLEFDSSIYNITSGSDLATLLNGLKCNNLVDEEYYSDEWRVIIDTKKD